MNNNDGSNDGLLLTEQGSLFSKNTIETSRSNRNLEVNELKFLNKIIKILARRFFIK